MEGVLVSRSVTVGTSGSVHGDLWHFPSGLLLVPSGMAATARHLAFRTVEPGERLRDDWAEGEVVELLRVNPSAVWIPFSKIRAARLYHRRLTSYIEISTAEPERKYRLACFRADDAIDYLVPVLAAALGEDAVVRPSSS